MNINVTIGNQTVTETALARTELRRSREAARFLRRYFHNSRPQQLLDSGTTDLTQIRQSLTDARLELGSDRIRERLSTLNTLSSASAKFADRASLRRRKYNFVEIHSDTGSAAVMKERLADLYSTASERNRFLGLYAAPHHYVLEPTADGRQEIIESFGGSPFPVHFYVRYGDEESLQFPADPTYPYQLAGAVRLADGTPIGGVRYQFRDEGDGFRVKAADEVSLVMPPVFVRNHGTNIAAEFVVWLREFAAESSSGTS